MLIIDVQRKILSTYKDTEEDDNEDKIFLEWAMVAFANAIVGISLNIIGKFPFDKPFVFHRSSIFENVADVCIHFQSIAKFDF